MVAEELGLSPDRIMLVEGDTARKDSDALKGDDSISKVALMLRARTGQ